MQEKFNVVQSEMLDKATEEQSVELFKSRLNYGWEFESIEKTNNPDAPYKLTLNRKKDCLPNVAPYGD